MGQFVFSDVNGTINASRRLERLRSTGLLTERQRPELDAITRVAAVLTQAQVAYVMLVDADRQIAPSAYGAAGQPTERFEAPISHSLCQYVVINDAPLVVEDARTHPVLSSHPAVLDGTLVAYAGVPIHTPDGEVVGALCALDVVARSWTPAQLAGLQDLAMAVDTKVALLLSRRELHLNHAELMHVLDGAAHTLILIADGQGVIRTMNHTAEDVLGHASNEAGTLTLSDLVEVPLSWRPDNGLGEAHDWTLMHDGEERIFSVRVNALFDPEGEVDGYIVVGDDVSARRTSEDLLRDTVRKQALAVARLEALDAQRSTFVATASHELRTPVTSILGYIEMLADGECGGLTPPQHSLVDRVVRNGHRLQHLVEDLLSLDQFESDNVDLVRTEIGVDQLTERAWSSLHGQLAGRDIQMSMDVPSDLCVSGDLVQLERALVHLLSNAIKFTPDGGAVHLSVAPDAHGIGFEVSDTGRGIAHEDQSAVFEPFFRTQDAHNNAVPGTGIGLTVARRIIEAHGGEVALTSVVGQGTRVRFTLPDGDPGPLAGRARIA